MIETTLQRTAITNQAETESAEVINGHKRALRRSLGNMVQQRVWEQPASLRSRLIDDFLEPYQTYCATLQQSPHSPNIGTFISNFIAQIRASNSAERRIIIDSFIAPPQNRTGR